ncbi:MAG: hypothetical protein EXS16_21815 [Gemmataceae bacterium]|nr:hypothetical protein [Gemmataceae bacterium]
MPTFDPAPITAIGDKIITDINAATWTPTGGVALTFTARRVFFLAEYQPTKADGSVDDTLRVDLLVNEDFDEELADRSNDCERFFTVALGVQKILADRTSKAEVDALVAFVNALARFYDLESPFVVSGTQRARCRKREIPVIYAPDELDRNGRFFSVIHLTFSGWYTD